MADAKLKEKERTAQLKALREELEAQIEQDLAGTSLQTGIASPPQSLADRNDVNRVELSPKRILEALLFATSKPLTLQEISKLTAGSGMTAKQVQSFVTELKAEYDREGRSFEVIEIAGGYQIVTRRAYADWLARLELQKKIKQASRSALETLAILAYKQPVTRAEAEGIRGVDISGVLSTLLDRGFIKIVGKKEVAGRPFMYGTTEKFLEHFGLKSLQDLPSIGEIKSLVERAVRKEDLMGENPSPQSPSSDSSRIGIAPVGQPSPQGEGGAPTDSPLPLGEGQGEG